jgi:selenocysteine lyase/cysteine desulfurase
VFAPLRRFNDHDRMIDIGSEFPGAVGYLNTASIGLPPQRAVDAMQQAIADWQMGRSQAPDYDTDVTEAREAFARLVSAPTENVAIGAQVSALVAMAVTTLEPGSQVLVPEGEFTSVLFPFLVRDDLDLDVREVSLGDLASSIGDDTDLVAFSAVQSSDGRVADLAAIRDAARSHHTLTLVDATQAAGWLPLVASDYDILVVSAYKWLLSPRGTAFMTLSDPLIKAMRPLYAGWYAGSEPWESIYGMPLRLAPDARRFDLSPGWLAWVGTAPALQVLLDVGVDRVHAHNVGLANQLLTELGHPPADSAIVSMDVDRDFDDRRLVGLATAYRAGRLRVGFHLYNSTADVAAVVAAIRG